MLKFQIEKLLSERDKSLYWLAKETGITYPTLHKIQNNQTVSVSLEVLGKLCIALNVDLNTLLKEED
ncbi:helix-turn-helix transcriptional regulator [Clostridium sp. YIM B02505]|uniref:Helix-turn-helix transcriptional regulator n=1 Tax=Clostridium yunnanense TaxID=2800325 RepID=A0ABS1EIG5_9CLOT|nr:helix-turn-helix transcriptional regulator [Clostridium yunnanense]MBK1809167.1 helix-turn-helix transcriptional regulator [Clostridium yunnanense]